MRDRKEQRSHVEQHHQGFIEAVDLIHLLTIVKPPQVALLMTTRTSQLISTQ